MKSWVHRYRYQIIIIAIILTLFLPALDNEFVLDDNAQLVENTLIHSLEYLPRLFIGSTFYGGRHTALEGLYYRPLMLSIFSLIYAVWGATPWPYHLIQIIFHTINALLVFYLLRNWFSPKTSLLASLIFALHPINVEAVVYISNLQDVGFTLFGLISTILVVSPPPFFKSRQYILSLVSLAIALLFKEVAIIFVVANSLYLYTTHHQHHRQYVKMASLITGIYILLRLNAVGAPTFDRVIPIADASLNERLLTLPRIHWYYLKTFLFPHTLAIGQNWVVRLFSSQQVLIPLLLSCTAYASLVFALKKTITQKYYSLIIFASCIFSVGLLIHSQLFPLDVTVANRWFYVPSIGLVSLLTFIFSRHITPTVFYRSTILIIILLSIRTSIRIANWDTAYSLYSHDYPLVKDSFTLENNLGLELLIQGDVDTAIYHLNRSTTLSPKWGISWNNLGGAYETKYHQTQDLQYLEMAISAYQKAIAYPTGYSPFINLARLYVDNNNTPEKTQSFIHQSLRLFPQNPDLWYLLSKSYADHLATPSAIQAARELVKYSPDPKADQWLVSLQQSPIAK